MASPPTGPEGEKTPLDDANSNCALGRWPRELPLFQPLVLAEGTLLAERVRLHREADRFVTVPRHCRGPKRACRFVTVPRLGRGPKRARLSAQSSFAEAGCEKRKESRYEDIYDIHTHDLALEPRHGGQQLARMTDVVVPSLGATAVPPSCPLASLHA